LERSKKVKDFLAAFTDDRQRAGQSPSAPTCDLSSHFQYFMSRLNGMRPLPNRLDAGPPAHKHGQYLSPS
jgi:hypothetical protein